MPPILDLTRTATNATIQSVFARVVVRLAPASLRLQNKCRDLAVGAWWISEAPAPCANYIIPENTLDNRKILMLTRIATSEKARGPAGEVDRVAAPHGIGRFITIVRFGRRENTVQSL